MNVDVDKLIEAINKTPIRSTDPLTYKWYTKQGYAQWQSALAVKRERQRIIKLIQEMSK